MSVRYISLINLDNIHNKLSSDYSLTVCFSHHFPYTVTDGQSFSRYKFALTSCSFSKGQLHADFFTNSPYSSSLICCLKTRLWGIMATFPMHNSK